MAHKKGQGSSRNGRDSNSQRLGVKAHDGNVVTGGTIIVRQRGRRFRPGLNAGLGKDDTIFAKVAGRVRFEDHGERELPETEGGRQSAVGRKQEAVNSAHGHWNRAHRFSRRRGLSVRREAGLSSGAEARAGRRPGSAADLRRGVWLVARMVWPVLRNATPGASIKPTFEFKPASFSTLTSERSLAPDCKRAPLDLLWHSERHEY